MARRRVRERGRGEREWPSIRAFRSLLAAQVVVVEAHRRHLEAAHGLAIGEFDMIAELGNTSGMRMGALGHKMITSPANVTRIVIQLEKRGWVTRRRAADSDREVLASLTPAGDAFFHMHFCEVVAFAGAPMESALSEE